MTPSRPPRAGEPRRVLLLTPDYPPQVYGGVGTHVHDLATGLARRGWEPTVVTPEPCSEPVTALEDGVRVVRMQFFDNGGNGEPVLRWRPIADVCSRLVRENRCHLFHVHDSFYAPVVEAVLKTTDLPLLLTQHNCFQAILERIESGKQEPLPTTMTRMRTRERRSLDLATAVICVSDVVAGELRAAGGRLPALHVVPNGVDVDFFARVDREEVGRVRAELAAPGERLVLFAGRPHGTKGLPELIVAATTVHGEAPEARFAFLLCTAERDKVAALRALGIGSGSITFVDNVPRAAMPAYFAAADVVAMPSRWEPFGLVALEAMAAARPLVVSDVAPLNEIVQDGATGRIVPRIDGPRGVVDAVELARTLLELVRMPPEALAEMGRRGQSRVAALYSVDRMVERTVVVYRQVTGAATRALGATAVPGWTAARTPTALLPSLGLVR